MKYSRLANPITSRRFVPPVPKRMLPSSAKQPVQATAHEALQQAVALFSGVLRGQGNEAARDALGAMDPDRVVPTLKALGMPPSLAQLVPDALAHTSVRVAFYSNQMCERGTEVALFDYADFGEKLLGLTAWVLYPIDAEHNFAPTIDKFRSRFGERLIPLRRSDHTQPTGAQPLPNFAQPSQQEVATILRRHGITHVYIIKVGVPDGPRLSAFAGTGAITLVHAVFDAIEPHGDFFARISPCVPTEAGSTVPVVPHIVRPIEPKGPDLREELGIPRNATVFGRHGGRDTFDAPEVRQAIALVARSRADVFFVLVNTPVLQGVENVPNVIYLEPFMQDAQRAAFLRTCDAMLHGRRTGETFGLAIAEFSVCNKPVITSSRYTEANTARFHLDTLGERGIYYSDCASLVRILSTFDRVDAPRHDWNAYRQFEPATVMQTFKRVFLRERVIGC